TILPRKQFADGSYFFCCPISLPETKKDPCSRSCDRPAGAFGVTKRIDAAYLASELEVQGEPHVDPPPERLGNSREPCHARTCVFQAPRCPQGGGHFAGLGCFRCGPIAR